jgi:hypothetical protein
METEVLMFKTINVYVAGVKVIHIKKREDAGMITSHTGFCGADCSELQLVSLPLTEMNVSCEICNKQVQLIRSIK